MPDLKYTVTRCRFADWKALDKIFAEAFSHIPPNERAYRLRNCYRGIRVFRVDGKIAGFTLHLHRKADNVAWLEQIALAKEFRGKGFGKTILKEYLSEAARAGYTEVQLAVRPDNAPAIALYKEFGFEPMSSKGPDLAFRKKISPAQLDSQSKKELTYFPNLPARVLLKLIYRAYAALSR